MHFVYYDDDYYDSGGVGLEELKEEEDVIKFIEERMKHHPSSNSDLTQYTVIKGVKLKIEPAEVIKSVKIKS